MKLFRKAKLPLTRSEKVLEFILIAFLCFVLGIFILLFKLKEY